MSKWAIAILFEFKLKFRFILPNTFSRAFWSFPFRLCKNAYHTSNESYETDAEYKSKSFDELDGCGMATIMPKSIVYCFANNVNVCTLFGLLHCLGILGVKRNRRNKAILWIRINQNDYNRILDLWHDMQVFHLCLFHIKREENTKRKKDECLQNGLTDSIYRFVHRFMIFWLRLWRCHQICLMHIVWKRVRVFCLFLFHRLHQRILFANRFSRIDMNR